MIKLAVSLILLSSSAYSQTVYYVSPTGNDGDRGTASKPLATIQSAVKKVKPGDTVVVMDGVYRNPGFQQADKTGWCQAVVKLKNIHGEPGKPIVFKSQHKHGAKLLFNGQGGFIGDNCSHIVIDGFEIEGPGGSISKREAVARRLKKSTYYRGWGIQFANDMDKNTYDLNHHIEIRNNHIHHTPNAGIRVQNCDYVTIEDNIVRECCWWSSDANPGIGIAEQREVDDKPIVKIIVRRNILYHNGNYNIFYIQGNNTARYGGRDYKKVDDGQGISFTRNNALESRARWKAGYNLIENNICVQNGINGITFHMTDNGIIRNNTVYCNNAHPGDKRYGGIAVNSGNNVKVYSNIVVGRPDKPNTILLNVHGPVSGIVAENNVIHHGKCADVFKKGLVVADPLFRKPSIDFPIGDFSLKPNSPAIDLGTRYDPASSDFLRRARPERAVVDAGAFEYTAGSSDNEALRGSNR